MLTKYYYDDRMKQDVVGETCRAHEGNRKFELFWLENLREGIALKNKSCLNGRVMIINLS